MSKVCKGCEVRKDLTEFYTNKGKPMGKCKTCVKTAVKANSVSVGDSYTSSEKGVIRVIYKTQKRNQKLRGHGELPYTKAELSVWLYENDFLNLYNNWISSGKQKDTKPSVDRIDSLLPYEFGNMRLVTWKENREAQYKDTLTGEGSSGLQCSRLRQISSSGCVMEEYTSYQEVRRLLGYCVHYAVKNKIPCKGGYFWELMEDA